MINEPTSNPIPVYYDDDDCEGGECYNRLHDYDDDYEDITSESATDIYQYCLAPSINDTAKYLLPLLISSVLFRLLAQNREYHE